MIINNYKHFYRLIRTSLSSLINQRFKVNIGNKTHHSTNVRSLEIILTVPWNSFLLRDYKHNGQVTLQGEEDQITKALSDQYEIDIHVFKTFHLGFH